MLCNFSLQNDSSWKCSRCGYVTKLGIKKSPFKNCRVLGLGDRLKIFLEWFKITPEFLKWLRGKRRVLGGGFTCVYVDISEEDAECGCKQRQENLNKLGDKINNIFV